MGKHHADGRGRPARGLTLVEVLAVITIIALLMALLVPAVSSVRESARRLSCGNNLKQFGTGVNNYMAAFDAFPPASTGVHGFTFYSLITNYVDDGAAAAFGSKLHLGHPAVRVNTPQNFPAITAVDAETIAMSATNEDVLKTMPQFAFFTCPTRGPRVTRGQQCNSDYVMVVPDIDGRSYGDLLQHALCVKTLYAGCWGRSPEAGGGILNFAIGRDRITQARMNALPSNWRGVYLFDVGWYTNMVEFNNGSIFNNPRSVAPELRFQRPYDSWSSRVRAESVPDGLSNTAVLAEKHLAAGELGFHGTSAYRVRWQAETLINGWNSWGLDSIKLFGCPEYREMGHFTRGIAFGPRDESSPYAGSGSGPTVGSWHAGNQVNLLMADGAVRSIASDIDTLYTMPMLGRRNDTDIRTDGRVLSLP